MSLWSRARMAAEMTPPHRNRTADFFRAAAISTVVFGHWMVSVPWYSEGQLVFTELLVKAPWTQYLTWVLQVMPIFFFVGGFSNAASWTSVRSDPERKRGWQASRLKRLLMPITPLILLWSLAAALLNAGGMDPQMIRDVTRAALIPVWFLAVYIIVSVLVPLSYSLWERFGLMSVIFLVVGAALVDAIAFAGGVGWLRWVNYAFIWLSMHQLGYWWYNGIGNRGLACAILIAAGLGSLYLLIAVFGYPVAMISVPGEEISNSRPPTFAMLAIGFTQAGVILALERRVADWLQAPGPWAVVILVSQRIMTVYLWHLTALLVLVGLALLLGGFGLGPEPGTALWWITRPVWLAAMAVVLLPLIAIFGRLEEGSRQGHSVPPGPVRSVLGALLACGGLTFMALDGTYGANAIGVNVVPVLLTLAGVALSTLNSRE